MVGREIPLADKGKAADSIWEVSQCFSCLFTLRLRLVETSIYVLVCWSLTLITKRDAWIWIYAA